MKKFTDGHWRLETLDVEILQFVHEQYLAAFQHLRILGQLLHHDGEWQRCHWRVRELVGYHYLEEKHWKHQGIHYFVLGWKGLRALKKRILRGQLMPLYRVPENLNRRIGDRFKAGMVRLIFRQLGFSEWTSERVLKIRDKRIYPLPTGELKIGNKKIAVYFERICKRPVKAYENLFEACMKWGYDEVWMIVEWNPAGFFSETWKKFHTLWPQVWFANYCEFVKKGADTRFANHEGTSFQLGDLVSDKKEALHS